MNSKISHLDYKNIVQMVNVLFSVIFYYNFVDLKEGEQKMEKFMGKSEEELSREIAEKCIRGALTVKEVFDVVRKDVLTMTVLIDCWYKQGYHDLIREMVMIKCIEHLENCYNIDSI